MRVDIWCFFFRKYSTCLAFKLSPACSHSHKYINIHARVKPPSYIRSSSSRRREKSTSYMIWMCQLSKIPGRVGFALYVVPAPRTLILLNQHSHHMLCQAPLLPRPIFSFIFLLMHVPSPFHLCDERIYCFKNLLLLHPLVRYLNYVF